MCNDPNFVKKLWELSLRVKTTCPNKLFLKNKKFFFLYLMMIDSSNLKISVSWMKHNLALAKISTLGKWVMYKLSPSSTDRLLVLIQTPLLLGKLSLFFSVKLVPDLFLCMWKKFWVEYRVDWMWCSNYVLTIPRW